jgi:hypothetical protein
MSLETGPVLNRGYYDVPICNELSNTDKREKPIKTNEYQLNNLIANTVNNNEGIYIVTQDPIFPSPSLYEESDYPQTGYYYNKRDRMSIAFDGRVPPGSKKTSPIYKYINSDINRPFGREDFDNMNNSSSHINKFIIILLIFIFIIVVLIYLK